LMMRLQQLGQTVKRQTLQLSWVTVQYKCCDRNEASVVPIIVAFAPIPDSSITVISDDQPVFLRTRTLRNGTEASNQQCARSLSKASHFCVPNNVRTTKHRKGARSETVRLSFLALLIWSCDHFVSSFNQTHLHAQPQNTSLSSV